MGHRNSKGTVSIINYKGRVRLRWRYLSERYSINLFAYTKENTLHARITALEIEQDIVIGRFDQTLVKYGVKQNEKEEPKTVVTYFEEWVSNYKQMDCERHTNYNSTRNMMRKWGKIEEGNIQKKLSLETNAAVMSNVSIKWTKKGLN